MLFYLVTLQIYLCFLLRQQMPAALFPRMTSYGLVWYGTSCNGNTLSWLNFL